MSEVLTQTNKIMRFSPKGRFADSQKAFELDFEKKTYIMGILNVTPDSFSDGGAYFDKDRAVSHALKMIEGGADIIDVGGESTRPGAEPVSIDEEMRRVISVIEELYSRVDVPISVDTSKPYVAKEAIQKGASIINNVMGSHIDMTMAAVAAECDVPIVLMHIKGEPRTMQESPVYYEVVNDILSDLKRAIEIAQRNGVDQKRIIIDPGIGFGKTTEQNLQSIKRLREVPALDRPMMLGVSRKAGRG
ncbi:MAG: dihydropteroate synthase, partial [Candidatus Omnitrophota bacterium]